MAYKDKNTGQTVNLIAETPHRVGNIILHKATTIDNDA